MKALRFHRYGEPAEVLQLDDAPVPPVPPHRVGVAVHACSLNPADWALCRGIFAKDLPRGIGLDVSGIVDAVGEGVTDVAPGDAVFGAADFRDVASAGASELAILDHWHRVPAGLSMDTAAALPLVTETAFRAVDNLGVQHGHTVLINGAGTMVGFAAVQIALRRGAHVVATAGETFAAQLRGFGARVTSYGAGLADRVRALAPHVDLALDIAPVAGVLPELIEIVDGDGRHVMTFIDVAGAKQLGTRTIFEGPPNQRYDILPDYAQRAAEGTFTIPIGASFALADWRSAMELSAGGHPHGKVLLRPRG